MSLRQLITTYLLKQKKVTIPFFLDLCLFTRQKPSALSTILSRMIKLNPELVNLIAFGTDGELELIKAFQICFPKAIHLRCTNYLQQNFKVKLHELKVSPSVSKEILAHIFDTHIGTLFDSGLADAESEAVFRKSLECLKSRWNNLEKSCNPIEKEPHFHN